MKAIEISSPGGPDVLKLVERPKPVAQAGEVVVRVEAAGIARADLLQREGRYPPPKGASDIPGLDLAGVVDSLGEEAAQKSGFKVGDQVCAILAGGGYAEYCAVPYQQLLPVPEGWTSVEAATLPENLFTVYDNIITRGGLKAGERILIHGGSSGIGSLAITLAKAWGAIPIVTAGTEEKCKACLGLGAAHAINYKTSDFASEVQRITEGAGVDVILDMVGGSYLAKNVQCLALEGRLVIIATQGGAVGELNILSLMLKRGRVIGSTMRARTPEQKGEVTKALLRDVWPLLPSKTQIRPLIDSTFPLSDASKAHQRLESGDHIGKVILIP